MAATPLPANSPTEANPSTPKQSVFSAADFFSTERDRIKRTSGQLMAIAGGETHSPHNYRIVLLSSSDASDTIGSAVICDWTWDV